MPDLSWTLESGPEDAPSVLELSIDYRFRFGTPDSWTEPGDPPEAEIEAATFGVENPEAKYGFDFFEVSLLPAEEERVLNHIYENPPEPDYGDDY